ncbi:MAG: hypothetical protein AABX09_02830, partial [Thermoproteota archaeon]
HECSVHVFDVFTDNIDIVVCHGLMFRDLYNQQSVRKVTSFGEIILTAIKLRVMLKNQNISLRKNIVVT